METNELPVEPQKRVGEYQSIADKMGKGRVIIDNMTVPEIAQVLKGVGYDTPQYTLGKTLYTNAEKEVADQSRENGEYHSAVTETTQFRRDLELDLKERFKLMRVAFESNYNAREILKLDERRKTSNNEWYLQQKAMYDNLLSNAAHVAELATVGMTEALLDEDRARLIELGKLISKQQKEFGDATTATTERDQKVELFFDWIDRYKKVAKIALARHPQYLDKLGI